MYVDVCMHVCIYVYMYVCIYVCMYIRDTEDTKESHHCYQWTCHHHHHVCIYVCMYMFTCMYVCMYVVLSVLLYGCESWTLLRRNLKSLESFHLRCLRRICGIQWTDYIPNTEVLSRCNISGIESFVILLGWSHVSNA